MWWDCQLGRQIRVAPVCHTFTPFQSLLPLLPSKPLSFILPFPVLICSSPFIPFSIILVISLFPSSPFFPLLFRSSFPPLPYPHFIPTLSLFLPQYHLYPSSFPKSAPWPFLSCILIHSPHPSLTYLSSPCVLLSDLYFPASIHPSFPPLYHPFSPSPSVVSPVITNFPLSFLGVSVIEVSDLFLFLFSSCYIVLFNYANTFSFLYSLFVFYELVKGTCLYIHIHMCRNPHTIRDILYIHWKIRRLGVFHLSTLKYQALFLRHTLFGTTTALFLFYPLKHLWLGGWVSVRKSLLVDVDWWGLDIGNGPHEVLPSDVT